MNKKGHLYIAKCMIDDSGIKHGFWFKVGSIAISENRKDHVSADVGIGSKREFTIDTAELVKRVKEQHECYEQAASDFENDKSNIMEVAYYVTYSYRMIFRKNQKQTDQMPFLELTTD